jgi:hypothetical protein
MLEHPALTAKCLAYSPAAGVVLGLLVLLRCGSPSNPNSGRTTPGGGMEIHTYYEEDGSSPVSIGYVNLLGSYVKDIGFNIYYPSGSDYSSFDI